MEVFTGKPLSELVASADRLGRRGQLPVLESYLGFHPMGRAMILNGMRRTGKSVLMLHAIASLPERERDACAYILIRNSDWSGEILAKIEELHGQGKSRFFLDEITECPDFADAARSFADNLAMRGIHVMLAGTNSFGFVLALDKSLLMKAREVRTTWIPWSESRRLTGRSLGEYIETGGVMNMEDGIWFDERYENSAIVDNILRSAAQCRDIPEYAELWELFESGELKSAIQRVVADTKHRFIEKVIMGTFSFPEYGLAASNARRASLFPAIGKKLEKARESIRSAFMDRLSIIEKGGHSVPAGERHADQVRGFLLAIGAFEKRKVIDFDGQPTEDEFMLVQPGMRWSQTKALLDLVDAGALQDLEEDEERLFRRKIDETARGIILEEIILVDAIKSMPDADVFTGRFKDGEFDMCIRSRVDGANGISLYEIKHSSVMSDWQAKNLKNERILGIIAKRYRRIRERAVIYMGPDMEAEDWIRYINAETFLKGGNAERPALPDREIAKKTQDFLKRLEKGAFRDAGLSEDGIRLEFGLDDPSGLLKIIAGTHCGAVVADILSGIVSETGDDVFREYSRANDIDIGRMRGELKLEGGGMEAMKGSMGPKFGDHLARALAERRISLLIAPAGKDGMIGFGLAIEIDGENVRDTGDPFMIRVCGHDPDEVERQFILRAFPKFAEEAGMLMKPGNGEHLS